MLCDALFQLLDDEEISQKWPWVVFFYCRLANQKDFDGNPVPIYVVPQDVKSWTWARKMGRTRGTIQHALDLLVERGYAREWERGQNNVRRFTFRTRRLIPQPMEHAA